jgi:DNA polymerase-3 subunit delta'
MIVMRGVIGQRVILDRLGARAARGDVAHAYGLFGPRSIGKRTVALRLAQTLNCLDPKRPSGGCGTCLNCVKIERGVHPDVRLLEREIAN